LCTRQSCKPHVTISGTDKAGDASKTKREAMYVVWHTATAGDREMFYQVQHWLLATSTSDKHFRLG